MAQTKRPARVAGNKSGNYVRARTRGGNEVRIYSDEAGGEFPVHGAWFYEGESRWIPAAWSIEGYVVSKEQPRGLDLDLKSIKF